LADPKQEESFKVIDRRLFNTEGEIRDEAVREERHKQEKEPSPASSLNSPAAGAQKRETATPKGSQKPEPARPEAAPEAEGLKPSRGIQMLINFVAQNAAMLLGAYPDPRSGQPIVDLEGARELIDMLDSLHEKTKGNLAPEEDTLLLDLLGKLKMTYLEVNQAVAAQAAATQPKARTRP